MKYQIKETMPKYKNWLEKPKDFLEQIVALTASNEVMIHEDINGTCLHDGKDWQTITITILMREEQEIV